MKTFLLLFGLLMATNSFALTNSQAALSDELRSLVWIQTDAKYPDDGDIGPAYCNATFVHPQVLITAAHCLRDAHLLKSFSVDIEVGRYKYVTRPDGTTVRVGYARFLKEKKPAKFIFTRSLTSKINAQGFKTQIGPQEDMALIVLSTPMTLPPEVKLMTVATQAEMRSIVSNITAYKPTVVSVNPIAAASTTDTKRFAELNVIKWNAAGYFESTSTSRVEEGDSGSALLMKTGADWKLIGVVKGRGQTVWSNWDVMTGLDQKACDMGQQIGNAELQATVCK